MVCITTKKRERKMTDASTFKHKTERGGAMDFILSCYPATSNLQITLWAQIVHENENKVTDQDLMDRVYL